MSFLMTDFSLVINYIKESWKEYFEELCNGDNEEQDRPCVCLWYDKGIG